MDTRTAAAASAAAKACVLLLAAVLAAGGARAAAVPVPLEDGLCPDGHAMCLDGSGCLAKEFFCDGNADCADETDEIHCDVRKAEAMEAVPAEDASVGGASAEKVDSRVESGEGLWEGEGDGEEEGEEEAAAVVSAGPDPGECLPEEHRCLDGTCIAKQRVCDGPRDCVDGSDEDVLAGCAASVNASAASPSPEAEAVWAAHLPPLREPRGCGADAFRCSDGSCVAASKVCDRHKDCADGGDELVSCPTDGPCDDGFRCAVDGLCIPLEWMCDGRAECRDGSDEDPSRCKSPPPPTAPANDSPHGNGEDRCALLAPNEQNLCREEQIQMLKVQELSLRQREARERLEGAQREAAAAKELAQERLAAAELQRLAAADLLHQQARLFHLRLQALSQAVGRINTTEPLPGAFEAGAIS